MFRRIDEPGSESATFLFEGERIAFHAGESVAEALLASGIRTFRQTPGSGQPRAPYCMMGVCFECLVEIDGVGNRQACLVRATDGMVVRSQSGPRELP